MKMIILILAIMPAVAAAQSAHTAKGDRLYREKKFPEALPEYQKAAEEDAANPVVMYNLGDAYFRNEKFEEAGKAFDRPIAEGNDPAMRQRAFYNKGVSLSRQSRLEESITAYKSALLLNPADNDARINLQKALLELKKKQEPEKDKKQDQQSRQKKKDNPPPQQSTMSKKQVEQLLKALDQREQQVQQKMMQNRARGVTRPDKDW